MIHSLLRILEILALLATISSIVYYALCLWSANAFLRESAREDSSPAYSPFISILKPLKGTDVEMYNNFRSHCVQDYPGYEIIFGVSDPQDPAIELVERLKREYPQRNIRLIFCEQTLGANTKVSNLAQMLPNARGELILVNDSDIRVPPDYLQKIAAPLSDAKVGLVTCPYRGIANPSLGSRLESLGISTDFIPGVLVARKLEGIKFGLGSTLLFRRRDLDEIGGFQSFVDYLADDYQIGARIAALGRKVVLSDTIVDSYLPAYTMRTFLDHQLRWARTVRDSRFWGYVGLGMTFGLPWAILTVILAQGAAWSWIVLASTLAMRLAVALRIGLLVVGDSQVNRSWAWLPVRDVLALGVWLLSFAGHTVAWRGTSYRLIQGKLARMTL